MGIPCQFGCAKFCLALIFCTVLCIPGFAQQASIPANATQSVHDDTPAVETVRGTLNIVAVDPAGATKSQPMDLTSWTINAWVQDRNGSYTKLAGKGNVNGTFAIAGVPAGSYWLEYGCGKCFPAVAPEFDEIDNRRPILGHYVAVPRPNLKAAAKGVALGFSVTGVPCYPPESAIGWHDFVWWFPNAAASQVVGGKDQLSFLDPCENPGVFSSAAQWSGPLMNAAAGDSGYLLGYAFAVGPRPELEIWDEEFVAAGYASEPLNMPDGKPLDVSGAASLSGAPGPQVQYSSFAALEQGSWSATSCTALPQWMGGQYGFLFPTPEEFFYRVMNHAVPPESIGCGGQALPLSNPFPAATMPLVYYFEDAGASNKNWAATAGSEIAPMVGPPAMVQLDGQDSFEHGGLTKPTPTLSWNDPAVGQASLYLVYLNRPRSTVLFTTRGRRLTVPPGILSPGDSYSLSLVAVYDSAGCAGNGDARLCEMSLEQGGAQLFSGVLEVPLPDGTVARSKPLANADDAQFGGNIAWQLRRHRERQEHIWTRFYGLEAARD
ncbi:MAG: hypothetical protein ABSD20_08735 [Terriglobales bacterium]